MDKVKETPEKQLELLSERSNEWKSFCSWLEMSRKLLVMQQEAHFALVDLLSEIILRESGRVE